MYGLPWRHAERRSECMMNVCWLLYVGTTLCRRTSTLKPTAGAWLGRVVVAVVADGLGGLGG